MSISLNVSGTVIPTKRGIVSDSSKTFDILGWMAPSTVCMKILYQKLWIAKIGWDDPAPTHLVHEHATWKSQLSVLSNVEFDRCYFRINEIPLTTQLHGFSDASELAFSAVVYIRSTYSSNPPLVKLVAAKTKVAPLKKITVPRLELCGAQLLAKLLNNIGIALSVPASDIYAWSDSTIVLSWLDGQAKRYKVYVGNRISTTLSLVPAECWAHVPTTINPADCASRGLSPSELANFKLWWKGPEFLWEEPFVKPPQPTISSITAPEQKATGQCNVVLPSKPLFLSGRYSNYHYWLKIAAWCLKYVKNHKAHQLPSDPIISSAQFSLGSTSLPTLTLQELKSAEHLLFKQSQSLYFSSELSSLHSSQPISSKSKIICLSPYLDPDGLLRVGGRLSGASLEHSQKHPLILCGHCVLVSELFKYNHVSLGHCGPTLLLSSVGSRLHVVGARSLARQICRGCVTCRKTSARSTYQMMGQLPQSRVSQHFPFEVTGMDYAGPLTIKKGHVRRPVYLKAYLALFVCFSTKAVHIEVVEDLSTVDFLAALKRFIARRGRPNQLHSDNGSNYVGARNDLQQLYKFLRDNQSPISNYLLSQRIAWYCIPERSPHFGGLWEAAVKAAKFHLKRVAGPIKFSFSELNTGMCQIEAILNSRPLTRASHLLISS